MEIGIAEVKKWLKELNEQIQQNKMYLTELDQAIGDGDHGLNMARGFQEVIKKIESTNYDNLGSLFKDTGMTLLSKVGGASGPLYGTAFLKAAANLTGKTTMSVLDLGNALESALDGIKMRGKANLHDKTMIDVWEPIVSYMKEHQENVNWDTIITLAQEKMEATKELEAKKGRAAYLGKRSIGHIDPGAVSSSYFFTELATVLKGANNE